MHCLLEPLYVELPSAPGYYGQGSEFGSIKKFGKHCKTQDRSRDAGVIETCNQREQCPDPLPPIHYNFILRSSSPCLLNTRKPQLQTINIMEDHIPHCPFRLDPASQVGLNLRKHLLARLRVRSIFLSELSVPRETKGIDIFARCININAKGSQSSPILTKS
jgi:hypothetical protein